MSYLADGEEADKDDQRTRKLQSPPRFFVFFKTFSLNLVWQLKRIIKGKVVRKPEAPTWTQTRAPLNRRPWQ